MEYDAKRAKIRQAMDPWAKDYVETLVRPVLGGQLGNQGDGTVTEPRVTLTTDHDRSTNSCVKRTISSRDRL